MELWKEQVHKENGNYKLNYKVEIGSRSGEWKWKWKCDCKMEIESRSGEWK